MLDGLRKPNIKRDARVVAQNLKSSCMRDIHHVIMESARPYDFKPRFTRLSIDSLSSLLLQLYMIDLVTRVGKSLAWRPPLRSRLGILWFPTFVPTYNTPSTSTSILTTTSDDLPFKSAKEQNLVWPSKASEEPVSPSKASEGLQGHTS